MKPAQQETEPRAGKKPNEPEPLLTWNLCSSSPTRNSMIPNSYKAEWRTKKWGAVLTLKTPKNSPKERDVYQIST